MQDNNQMDDEQIKARKANALKEFAKALEDAQSVQFVAIVKQEGKATYKTGGFKGLGPTPYDLAKAIGAQAVELAEIVLSAAQAAGKEATYDEAIEGVFDGISEGAENSRVQKGIIVADHSKDDRIKGAGGAPRGF